MALVYDYTANFLMVLRPNLRPAGLIQNGQLSLMENRDLFEQRPRPTGVFDRQTIGNRCDQLQVDLGALG
jgi:hypothetical protein